MVQYLAVALIVLLAIVHAARKFLPVTWRQHIVHRLTGGVGGGWFAKWFGVDASCGSGCDTCGSCETDAAPLPERDANGRKIIRLKVER